MCVDHAKRKPPQHPDTSTRHAPRHQTGIPTRTTTRYGRNGGYGGPIGLDWARAIIRGMNYVPERAAFVRYVNPRQSVTRGLAMQPAHQARGTEPLPLGCTF